MSDRNLSSFFVTEALRSGAKREDIRRGDHPDGYYCYEIIFPENPVKQS